MADTVTASSYLGITLNNSVNNENARNQTLKVPEPKTNLTEQQIKTVINDALTNQILIDNDGTTYTNESEVVTAFTEFSTVRVLDIGIE